MIVWSRLRINRCLSKLLLSWEGNFKLQTKVLEKKVKLRKARKQKNQQKEKDKLKKTSPPKLPGSSKLKELFSPISCKGEKVKLDLMWKSRILISLSKKYNSILRSTMHKWVRSKR